ncbi:MAG: IS3 family transposase, partial [Bacteroidota bacterium]|nr:IS3 family transposase [Bacteroidota bacterium]
GDAGRREPQAKARGHDPEAGERNTKKSSGVLCKRTDVRYAFIERHAKDYPIKLMSLVLKVSRSGYYAWQGRPESKRRKENMRLTCKIKAIHKKSRENYGSPRIHKRLKAEGEACSKGRVERLMAANGIKAKQARRYKATTDSMHKQAVSENILAREFTVEAPNKVWVSDITYIPTGEGWLYLAGVLDLCTKRAVGWSMKDRLDRRLVIEALRMAYQRRSPGEGLIHHSDRGSQYASSDYQKLLREYGMQASMSRKGNCWDNAPMESFFGTLKKELIHHRKYRTREEARRDIFEYIEVFYNRERLHSSLGYLSPADYEKQIALKQAA